MTVVTQHIANLPYLNIEQKILCDEFFKRFDFGAGSAFDVINVEPLLYEGAIAGSEFLTYDANKLYLCFDIYIGYSAGATAAAARSIRFSDENDVINLCIQNNSIAYESIAASIFYNSNNMNVKNLYFSRFVNQLYYYLKFIGYRISY